jgi:flagellar basal body-associated protein FliL
MATDAEEMDDGTEEPRAKGGKGGLVLIIVTLLALAGGGFGAWKFFGAKRAETRGGSIFRRATSIQIRRSS